MMRAPDTALVMALIAAAVALLVALVPIPALASLREGLLHPLLVPAHALALVGLGLLIGQDPRRQRAALLVAFVAALIAGIAAIMAAFIFTEGSAVLLAVAGIAGLLVALARPVPMLAGAPLTAIAGAALAFDSVPQEISISATLLALAGTAIGAAIALTLIAEARVSLKPPWLRIGARILGSWIAASAILVLALRLAR
jgi:urease accessory protein